MNKTPDKQRLTVKTAEVRDAESGVILHIPPHTPLTLYLCIDRGRPQS